MSGMRADWAEILAEMQAYYNARAGEYDQWFLRVGRFDRGPEQRQRWNAEIDVVRHALRQLRPTGRVLELAAGTGIWTGLLAESADSVLAVDGSVEALRISRAKHAGRPNIRYEQADLFTWQPARPYDAVAMGFWISHVPPAMLDEHLAMIRRALRPGGGVFLADSLYSPDSSAADHPPQNTPDHVVTRRLNDGSAYRVVKVFRDPPELEADFARAGLPLSISTAGEFFHYAAQPIAEPKN